MTVTKNAVIDTSPFAEFTDITSQQLAVIAGEIIIFHIDQYIYPYVGVYTISFLYTWSGPSTLTRVFTFEVIDPCILEIVPPAVIPSQTLEFTFAPYFQPVQPTIATIYQPYCFFDVTVTKTHDTVPDLSMMFVSFVDLVQVGLLTHPLIEV
jgi:hypothetical protein